MSRRYLLLSTSIMLAWFAQMVQAHLAKTKAKPPVATKEQIATLDRTGFKTATTERRGAMRST